MAKELACENCGKTWRVDYPSTALEVKVQSCQECGRFKFRLEPVNGKRTVPTSNK